MNLSNLFIKYNIKPYKYKYINKALIVYSDKIYVIKKNAYKEDLYNFLEGNDFNLFLRPINYYEDLVIYNYLENNNKIELNNLLNMINSLAIMHSKTTSFKELSLDRVKEIYEGFNDNIDYLYNYYSSLEDSFNLNTFNSPEEYLFLRNISYIYSNLDFCKYLNELFYELANKSNKYRECLIINHLDIDNFINGYFTNLDHASINSPVYDLIDLYKNYYDKDFNSLYKVYKSNYVLNRLEEVYFLLNISIPWKISFNDTHFNNTYNVHRLIDYISYNHEFNLLNNKIYEKDNNGN